MSELKDYSVLDIEAIDDERYEKEKAPGKWVTESRVYLKKDVDAALAAKDQEIAELKAALEDEKNARYADSVDAGMRERRLKRALWLMGAMLGKMGSLAYHNIKAKLYFLDDGEGVKWALQKRDQWEKVESKCHAMAEKFGD